MSRRGENIYFRKDGRWEGRCPVGKRANGTTRFYSVYGRKYSEVKVKLMSLKAQHAAPSSTPVIYGSGNASDWMDYWLNVLCVPYIKKSSYGVYRAIIDTHLEPAFGSMKLSALTAKVLQLWLDQLSARLAPSTVHNICRVLNNILAKAVDRELLRKNPLKDVRKPKYEVKQARYLSKPEQKVLERAIRSKGRLEYLVCLYTGLRLGELCALRWEDVDFLNNELHICHTVQRIKQYGASGTEIVIGTPKSFSSQRDIPVPKFLMEELKRWGKTDGYVFESGNGGCMNPRTVQERFTEIAKRAGFSGVHMHTLRHTYATRCLEAGMQYETLSDLLGHSSPLVTMKCYAHCTSEQKHHYVNRLHLLAGNF